MKTTIILLFLLLLSGCGVRHSQRALIDSHINPLCMVGCYAIVGAVDTDGDKTLQTDLTKGTAIGISANKAITQ